MSKGSAAGMDGNSALKASGRPVARRAGAGFTLIELLVAVAVSVILLSILAFVFQLSTQATRNANTQVAITERMRSLNIRMRQEIGAMLPIKRGENADKPPCDYTETSITFCADTTENGKAVSNDVKYEWVKEGADKTKWRLVRYRDETGKYNPQKPDELNPPEKYIRGDDKFIRPTDADIMVTNVQELKFTVIDEPPKEANANELNPRELPAAVKMEIRFGPDPASGDPDALESATFYFPVYRGM